jgi:AcrR family transcriptional regulator
MRVKDEEKVTRIYHAAMVVINREGFQGSSMSKIAGEANVSAATIYLYFENKEDMLNKLYVHLKSKMGHSFFRDGTDLTPSKGTFRTIWLNHYQYIIDNIEEYNFLENFSNCPLINLVDKENTLDYCPVFENLFEQSKKTGLLQPMNNDMIYSLLFAPVSYLVKKNRTNGTTISVNEFMQIFEASWRAVCK